MTRRQIDSAEEDGKVREWMMTKEEIEIVGLHRECAQ